MQDFLEGVGQCGPYGQSLDPLGAPFSADLVASYAPHLFGIRPEERVVELFTEPVNKELRQGSFLFDGEQGALNVAEADAKSPPRTELQQCALAQGDRVIE